MPELDLSYIPFVILNFLIAAGILIFFLFKPVLRIMQKRQEAVDKVMDDAKQAKEDALAMQEENKRTRSVLINESDDIKGQIINQGREEKERILAEAHEEARVILAKAQSEAEEQEQAWDEKTQRGILELSSVMAEKVLNRTLTDEEKSGSIDSFIESWDGAEDLLA